LGVRRNEDMVDTKRLRNYATTLSAHVKHGRGTLSMGDRGTVAELLAAAADEIDAGRDARLVQYRCAVRVAMPHIAEHAVEGHAHMMLAAERPVTP
jgi:hypothetical protein